MKSFVLKVWINDSSQLNSRIVGIPKKYLKNYCIIHKSKFSSINYIPINVHQTNLPVIATAVFKVNTGMLLVLLKMIFKIQVDENYSLPSRV